MKYLDLSNNGGDPFTLDDLERMQTGIIDSLIGPLKDYVGTKVIIINGCQFTLTGTVLSWTNGLLYDWFTGKMHTIAAGNVNLPAGYYSVFSFSIDTDATGDVNYENGNLVHNWKINTATVIADNTIPPNDVRNQVISYVEAINGVKQQVTAWHNIGASGEPSFLTIWSNYISRPSPASYKRNSDGGITLKGVIQGTAGAAGLYNLFTLPAGFWPMQDTYFSIISDTLSSCLMYINASTGLVSIVLPAAGTFILGINCNFYTN